MSVSSISKQFAQLSLSGKKSVLSNKALTRRVRALTGTEGERTTGFQNLYNAVTLGVNSSDINYLAGMNSLTNSLIHRMRVWVNITAVANSTTRIIVFEDTQLSATDLVSANILQIEEPFSSYAQDGAVVHPWSAKRLNKNIGSIARCRILKDIIIGQTLTANTRVARMFDVNFHGRRADQQVGWGFLVISDQMNVVDIQVLVDSTSLSS